MSELCENSKLKFLEVFQVLGNEDLTSSHTNTMRNNLEEQGERERARGEKKNRMMDGP